MLAKKNISFQRSLTCQTTLSNIFAKKKNNRMLHKVSFLQNIADFKNEQIIRKHKLSIN